MSQILAKATQAEQLLSQGKGAEALSLVQRILPKAPGDPGLNTIAARASLLVGRFEQAEFYARRACAGAPDAPELVLTLADSLTVQGRGDEAIAALERAVVVAPSHPDVRLALANHLLDRNDSERAASHLRAVLDAGPSAQASISYAGALLGMGRAAESAAFLREAIARFPDEPLLVGGLPATLVYVQDTDPDELAAAHRAFGRVLDRIRPALRFEHGGSRDPERRLRIGFVSPDLRQHSVAYFIEPFLEHHDRAAFDVVGYLTARRGDAVSDRLRAHCALWRECGSLSNLQLAELINEDRIDIAVDLAGHMMHNSLPAFHLKPAPVQATYCGYPDTTGLTQVDYRLVDSLTDQPTPEVDARATENLYRLDPCFLCYRPMANAPTPQRAHRDAPVFGSFNAARKLNDRVLACWARLLDAVPGSRLVLKSFDFASGAAANRIRDAIATHGVDPQRLTFHGATPTVAEHLALYAGMDVALDAFPYNGTTTTCEALWMGVPVVALAGRTHGSRVGVSLLTNAGVPELIAASEDEYVRAAAELAADAPRLDRYRSTLRGLLAGSPVCDAAGFASRFGAALRDMWRRECATTR